MTPLISWKNAYLIPSNAVAAANEESFIMPCCNGVRVAVEAAAVVLAGLEVVTGVEVTVLAVPWLPTLILTPNATAITKTRTSSTIINFFFVRPNIIDFCSVAASFATSGA